MSLNLRVVCIETVAMVTPVTCQVIASTSSSTNISIKYCQAHVKCAVKFQDVCAPCAVQLQRNLGGQIASRAPIRLPQYRVLSGRCLLKATFYYCSQLQTWLSTRFAARFSISSCGFATCFRHAFDFFCRKPGREPAASISTCGRHQVLSTLAAGFRPACEVLSTRSRKSKARFAARFAACQNNGIKSNQIKK